MMFMSLVSFNSNTTGATRWGRWFAPRFFCWVRVAQSLVFCAVFYIPLLGILSFIFFLSFSSYQSISFCFRWFRFISFPFRWFRFVYLLLAYITRNSIQAGFACRQTFRSSNVIFLFVFVCVSVFMNYKVSGVGMLRVMYASSKYGQTCKMGYN
jgi:hypothetical protein